MATPSANLLPPSNVTAFGSAIAVRGTTAVIGGGTDDDSSAAYLFSLQSGVANINSIATLTASDHGRFLGNSVAILGDTVVAGAPGYDSFRGALYVYVAPPTGWTDMTQTAELSVNVKHLGVGASVAISDRMIVAGAPSGKVSVVVAYVKPPSGWVDSRAPRYWGTSSDGSAAFGEAVALGGKTVAVCDFEANQSQGSVYIFAKP